MIFVLTSNTFFTTYAMKKAHPPTSPPTYTALLIQKAYDDNEPWISGFERAYLAQKAARAKRGLSVWGRYSLYSKMVHCEIYWAETEEGHAYWSAVYKELREAGK
jgi:hypothetical protein